METTEKQFKYYAFISYSHKDKKEADWIHNKLTFYRLPSYAVAELGEQDVKLSPICLDKHSLPPAPLWEILKQKLSESRFLIVVCSPNSAKPGLNGEHWVNREVEYFAQIHGADKVIPVIVGGVPGDAENECFCPSLKELKLLALDMTAKETPRKKILTFLAAKLLGLDPDMLWRYDLQEKSKSLKRKLLLLSPLLLLIALIAAFVIDCNRLVVNHYADYVDSYGLPQGIFQLEEDDLPERHVHYRFEYRGYRLGKSIHADSSDWSFFRLFGMQRVLQRVVQANSKGNPMERNHTELKIRPAIQVFKYDNDLSFFAKKLISATWRNPGGEEGLIKQILLYHDRGNVINGRIEIRTPNNDPMRQAARLTISRDDVDNTKFHSKEFSTITGYRLERDKNGRPERVINMDPYGNEIADEDGIMAFELELDDYGRHKQIWYLVKDGENWKRKENKGEVAGKIYEYENANMTKAQYVNSSQTPVVGPYGWAVCENEFENGNCIAEIFKDSKGAVTIHKDLEVKGWIIEYKDGNQVMQMYHAGKDKNGNWIPAMAKEYTDETKTEKRESYAYIYAEYNTDGYLKKITYKNLDGEICSSVLEKFAITTFQYSDGKLTDQYFFDEKEKPVLDRNGIHHAHIEYYPGTGEISRHTYYALDNQGGIWGNKNVHKVIREFDKNGNVSGVYFYATKDDFTPAANEDGISKIIYQYYSNGHTKQIDYYAPEGATGGVFGGPEVTHAVELYNESGKPIENTYYASQDESKPVANLHGAGKVVFQYHSNGHTKRIDYYAPEGASGGVFGGAEVTHAVELYDETGKSIENTYYASQDESKPVVNRDGAGKVVFQYHSNGHTKRIDYYAPEGASGGVFGGPEATYAVELYDEFGRSKEGVCYASKDDLTQVASGVGVGKIVAEYHANGHTKRIDYYAPEGASGGVFGGPEVTHAVELYNESCKLFEQTYYASQDESKPVANRHGVSRMIWKYDAQGNCIERISYDIHENVIKREDMRSAFQKIIDALAPLQKKKQENMERQMKK